MDLQIGKLYRSQRENLLVIVLEQWDAENYLSMKDRYYKLYVIGNGKIITLSKTYLELNYLDPRFETLSPT